MIMMKDQWRRDNSSHDKDIGTRATGWTRGLRETTGSPNTRNRREWERRAYRCTARACIHSDVKATAVKETPKIPMAMILNGQHHHHLLRPLLASPSIVCSSVRPFVCRRTSRALDSQLTAKQCNFSGKTRIMITCDALCFSS